MKAQAGALHQTTTSALFVRRAGIHHAHLLPRVKAMLDAERRDQDSLIPCSEAENMLNENTLEHDGIHFKSNHMYKHNIIRINYTSYDVRRAQDVINPKTNHQNVMILSPQDPDLPCHQYDYTLAYTMSTLNYIQRAR